ncbi:TetR/AcrR family transcriptional regulator [Nonomuraea sp. NPDC048826]|uniref:TetR/AcrR family transcriptional regulator n=1 Tax=Nonomuraea sp. NPDC048826 TaxID=3364347 RepID=UPI00371C2288
MTGTRAEQREATRRALVAAGRRLFAGEGYAAVGLAEIVREAGVTKGALYHHFDGKAALFRAVLEEAQREVADQVAAEADAAGDPWEQLKAGCAAFVRAAAGPGVRRIMLIDGPAVLGWAEWRAIDEAASARHLGEALAALAENGEIAAGPVAPLTHLLSGAMNEAVLWLARPESEPGDLDDTLAALSRMLDGLRVRT